MLSGRLPICGCGLFPGLMRAGVLWSPLDGCVVDPALPAALMSVPHGPPQTGFPEGTGGLCWPCLSLRSARCSMSRDSKVSDILVPVFAVSGMLLGEAAECTGLPVCPRRLSRGQPASSPIPSCPRHGVVCWLTLLRAVQGVRCRADQRCGRCRCPFREQGTWRDTWRESTDRGCVVSPGEQDRRTDHVCCASGRPTEWAWWVSQERWGGSKDGGKEQQARHLACRGHPLCAGVHASAPADMWLPQRTASQRECCVF